MARYPGAKWRPVTGHTDGPMRSYRGAVLHVNESDGNLYNWVAGNHDMSCHFEVYKDGTVEQFLDTGTTSWCQMAGNADWISIETEGYHTEPLTGAQVHAIAALYGWLHATHGIPLQIADTPDGHGFGWHGMGGAAWGGHTDCPGPDRKAQRANILTLAQTSPIPSSATEARMATLDADDKQFIQSVVQNNAQAIIAAVKVTNQNVTRQANAVQAAVAALPAGKADGTYTKADLEAALAKALDGATINTEG